MIVKHASSLTMIVHQISMADDVLPPTRAYRKLSDVPRLLPSKLLTRAASRHKLSEEKMKTETLIFSRRPRSTRKRLEESSEKHSSEVLSDSLEQNFHQKEPDTSQCERNEDMGSPKRLKKTEGSTTEDRRRPDNNNKEQDGELQTGTSTPDIIVTRIASCQKQKDGVNECSASCSRDSAASLSQR